MHLPSPLSRRRLQLGAVLPSFAACAAVAVVVAGLAAPSLHADEGMWTFNNFPADQLQKSHGFKPDQAWLDKVRLGSARLAQGCSASFVSKDGLVMTNHHCAHTCIAQLSTKKNDYVKSGFYAASRAKEMPCPALEVNQLESITDVTAQVNAATKGKSGAAYTDAMKAVTATIAKKCSTSDAVRCDVVTLYKGGRYDLYQYRRYQDVRLVFAPELGIAFFGGDPDNFNFPRYDLDAAFVRVYEDGKPLVAKHVLPFAKTPAKAGDLTFVTGHPGHTSREYTIAELAFERDYGQPQRLYRYAEWRGQLTEFRRRGPEQSRIAGKDLFSIENGLKARLGREAALADEDFFATKVKEQNDLIAAIKDPALKRDTVKAISDIAAAMKTQRALWMAYVQLEAGWGPYSDSFRQARALVRAADELPKANELRLTEYTDAKLPALRQSVLSKAPIYKDLEELKLIFGLTKLRETLTPSDPITKLVLGKKSPEELTKELLKTRLDQPKERARLWAAIEKGDRSGIDKSKDPMILFARRIDGDARALRTRYENEVESVVDAASETIAKARFAVYGTTRAPDATFTLRLSFGTLKGWKERGVDVDPITTVGGAFEHHTGQDPFALPNSWLKAKNKVDATTPMNFVTTNDIIGGNSGSPVVNRAGEVIGLIFDGNIHSLGGEYGFNPENNRAVAVHTSVILEALRKIYGAGALADELTTP